MFLIILSSFTFAPISYCNLQSHPIFFHHISYAHALVSFLHFPPHSPFTATIGLSLLHIPSYTCSSIFSPFSSTFSIHDNSWVKRPHLPATGHRILPTGKPPHPHLLFTPLFHTSKPKFCCASSTGIPPSTSFIFFVTGVSKNDS